MRPKGSAAVLEARRRRALALWKRDLSLNEVGRRLGCAPSSVKRWRDAVAAQGAEGLRVRASPGRPRKLTAVQQRRLGTLLLAGPLAAGDRTDCRAHSGALPDLVSSRSCGAAAPSTRLDRTETRAPVARAGRGGDCSVEDAHLGAGKKNAARLKAHVVFVDESGFLLIPTVRRT